MNTNEKKRGFTLIELLVVIAIIGVLSSIVLASIKSVRIRANDADRVASIKAVKTALEMYYNDNHTYPQYLDPDTAHNAKKLQNFLVPTYMPVIPQNFYRDFDYYTWSGTDSYGLQVFTETAHNYCKTGVNMNPGWWNTPPTPECNF